MSAALFKVQRRGPVTGLIGNCWVHKKLFELSHWVHTKLFEFRQLLHLEK